MKRSVLKPEMKLGAEPKKLALLAGLLVLAAFFYFYLREPSVETRNPAPAAAKTAAPEPAPVATVAPRGPAPRPSIARYAGQGRAGGLSEFKPTLKPKEPVDPAKVDPTLKLVLFDRLRRVGVETSGRSLFDFSGAGPAPAPVVAKVKPIIPGAGPRPFVGPVPPPPKVAAVEPPKPPPVPIPLKFYGFTTAVRVKRAFFLDGEEIHVAGEGDVIKNRYRVVRIGVNSAVLEDTSDKHQQTLPLEAEATIQS